MPQQWTRNEYGHTVIGRAGLESVAQAVAGIALLPLAGIVGIGDVDVGGDVLRGEVEQRLVGSARLLPPGVEVACRGDLGADAMVVKVEQLVFGDHHVAASCAVFDFGGVGQQRPIAFEERMIRLPIAFDEGVPDEHVARRRGVDGAVVDAASGHQRDAVERRTFVCHRRTALRRPVRLAVCAFDQVACESFGPQRVDSRDGVREKS